MTTLMVIGVRDSHCVAATDPDPERVRLWPEDAPGALGTEAKDVPSLIVHLAKPLGTTTGTTTVLVCPGGGYGGLAMGHEGQQIAEWWNEHGVSAFILDYRHRGKGYGHPSPLLDAQRGLRTIRALAASWHVNPDRIGVMGFSAGGHLASSLGTHFDAGQGDDVDPIERVSCRPDFMILCYPVIAFDEPFTHRGSQRNLLGDAPPPGWVRSLSNEKQVSSNCPPTFLFQTDADQSVPAENSVAFYLALRAAKVPAELHIYQHGPHGVGLASQVPGTSSWPDRCLDWMRGLELLPGRRATHTNRSDGRATETENANHE